MKGNNAMREPILSIRDLTKIFEISDASFFAKKRPLYALRNVSVDLYPQETLGVIGESGCGKSTLGKCIVRLHKPTRGSILYKGVDIAKASLAEVKPFRKDIQMIFQDPFSSLDARMTALKTIEEAFIVHGLEPDPAKREQRALAVLKEVGLDEQYANRYPHEFSGGQRQRINIGRALALGPRIIVCDEPVSALDVSIQAQVINLLKQLQKEHGLTYLFISHDLSVIRHMSDRIAIMYLGEIVELCDSAEIYSHPLHPYTRALLSAIPPESPLEKQEKIRLKGDVPSPIGERKSCGFCTRCPYATERCRKEIPALTDAGDGHMIACFLHNGQTCQEET